MIIAVDFDGTCVTHEFPATGAEIGAAPVLKELVDNGHKLVLNTMRSNTDKGKNKGPHLDNAVAWFEGHGIPLYGVNTNPNQKYWTESPKVYAELYIDDAALGCPLMTEVGLSTKPFVDWNEVRGFLSVQGIL